MTIQRIAVSRDQDFEGVAVSGEDALNDELIELLTILNALIGLRGRFRRFHDERVTRRPPFGQGAAHAGSCVYSCHVLRTNRTSTG